MKSIKYYEDKVIINLEADLKEDSFGISKFDLIGDTDALIVGLSCLVDSISSRSKLETNTILKMIQENIKEMNQ